MARQCLLLDPDRGPRIVSKLIKSIERGTPRPSCCDIAGIDYSTFCKWMRDAKKVLTQGGEDTCDDYTKACVKLFHAVRLAEAEAIDRNIGLIQVAATNDWRAAAWFLERRAPADFGRKDEIKHVGAGGGPVLVQDVLMHQMMDLAMKAKKGPPIVDDEVIDGAVLECLEETAQVPPDGLPSGLIEDGDESGDAGDEGDDDTTEGVDFDDETTLGEA